MNTWKIEIERKYLVSTNFMDTLKKRALQQGFLDCGSVLQRDWAPDFEQNQLKESGILLRIRKEFRSSKADQWVVTLKKSSMSNGTHTNLELETTSNTSRNYSKIENILSHIANKKVIVGSIIAEDQSYLKEIKLTKIRMLSEKKRHTFAKQGVLLSFDDFPEPLGHYIEIEVGTNKEDLLSWEKALKLTSLPIEERNYGQLIKDTIGSRKLVFSE